ncbi:MAG: DNA mismatch endonuclease Vsr [candidate division Zixibacteria bacterium]|nr:DNA mismatch endonuclease Vsr [candidate division Zixibacteria bacterium]
MDVHSPKIRSFNMSRIRGGHTKPEIFLRRLLWHCGYRYRLHRKDLPGTPDIVFPSRKKVILVHGCFWHKHNCRFFKWPQTNPVFWKKKIQENCRRDRKAYAKLSRSGWHYNVVWECQLKGDRLHRTLSKITDFLEPTTPPPKGNFL